MMCNVHVFDTLCPSHIYWPFDTFWNGKCLDNACVAFVAYFFAHSVVARASRAEGNAGIWWQMTVWRRSCSSPTLLVKSIKCAGARSLRLICACSSSKLVALRMRRAGLWGYWQPATARTAVRRPRGPMMIGGPPSLENKLCSFHSNTCNLSNMFAVFQSRLVGSGCLQQVKRSTTGS